MIARMRFVMTRFTGLARLRAVWWYLIRGYRYEMCKACGRPVCEREGREPLSWWHAPDALWMEVVGNEANILCKSCFSHACDERGISIYWQPVVEFRR
jgi:hypothetical protein